MDRTSIWFLGFVCIVLAILEQNTVQGKCKGKWAIHACRGGNGKRSDPSETQLDAFSLRNARRRQFLESLRGLNTLPEGYGYEQDAEEEVTPERLQALDEDTLGSEANREMLRQEEEEEEDKSLRDAQLTESLWRKLISQLRDLDRENEMADSV